MERWTMRLQELQLDQSQGIDTSCIEADISFHDSFDPSSEFNLVVGAEDVNPLRGERYCSGGPGRGRNNFEDVLAASCEADFPCWAGGRLAFCGWD